MESINISLQKVVCEFIADKKSASADINRSLASIKSPVFKEVSACLMV